MPRFSHLIIFTVLAFFFAGCSSNRSAVITSGTQIADLWWEGELTDHAGNRWDVAILPGMMPTFRGAGDAFARSAHRFTYYADGEYWHEVGELSKSCFAFAGADCLRDFMVHGIGDDYSDTTKTLGSLVDEKPFGWIAQIVWRTLWGYAIKPVGRIVLAPVGAAGGVVAGAVLVPVGSVLYPPVVGVADVAVFGITVPALRIVWNQVAWTVCLFNDEPSENQDGHWGLHIIKRPEGWKPPQNSAGRFRVESPEQNGPVKIDSARMRYLVLESVHLERSLAIQARHGRKFKLQHEGLQRIDGSRPELQIDDEARRWLETEAEKLCDQVLDEVRRQDPTLELPSRDAILKGLREALGLPAESRKLDGPDSPDSPDTVPEPQSR